MTPSPIPNEGPVSDRFRYTWREFSGSLGDLGLFIPLVVGMTITMDLDMGVILILAGLMNILSGWLFRQPIPVQPMKAIAAVAITEQLTQNELVAAGLLMGVLIFALSGVADRINRLVPKAIVRGIQLGVGLKLAAKGAAYVGALPVIGWDSIVLAFGLAAFLLFMVTRRRQPALLYVFMLGFVVMALDRPAVYGDLHMTLPDLRWHWPEASAWAGGFLKGALPQMPLTILNSVIAVCALSADYFPGRGIAPRRMAASVAIMNLVSVPLGGIPMCHGAGGLAAQYRFGARTGASVVMLGVVKVAVGLVFGGALLSLLTAYPMAILGPMLVFAGIELARSARDVAANTSHLTIALVTAAFIIGVDTWMGFLAGCALACAFKFHERTRGKSASDSGIGG